ncbi:hypothetical protein G6F46_012098 [Rhizopus delemar]|uniref:Tyr recombinase domain-containing protein n=2 Tax=Rhizopus TaxID=4842 RepID=A0A9P7CIC5_9FUNG|nr:hypothetical protein G6F55_011404 [Rhizopus delemar]KAG1534618.1 hypothetical protein G6F51_011995 [Rhizopus arrhizus]KAG1489014.1 hypothetical protein G6F54_011740 [Rhizopus delemar]KAG1495847.1 hypothetical protein G6F53_012291 [Rhizopus delemar]KAG1511209.1 hypothetical protein G6F52_010706 [Rhizopus delemar]
MKDAGIDTSIYKTHSIRSASSTKAIESGQLAADVQDHVGWSKKTNTMDKYYYKPTAQKTKSTKIVNSIFSTTENNTTSEVETEAIEIVLGTTCNSKIAEVETEDVVQPAPSTSWFRFW